MFLSCGLIPANEKERDKGKRGRREGEKRGGGEKGESDSDGEGGEHK